MKIIEIELINHVVIPESFHVNLRDKTDVIAIDGLNGSGKSFLINNIHPLASNRRHKDRYAIRKGKGGLKRIIYELDNHRNLEIIHEYVVNGKRHSCKSYCNLIIDGVKDELNPTGHTKKFDELIAEYLYFDNDTFTCTFLSPKAESIVNATSAKRKDILKSTMKSSKILERAQSKNRDVITDTTQTIKIYSKQMEDMYKNLPFKTIEEFDNRLEDIDHTLESLNYKKNNSSAILLKYKLFLGQLTSKDISVIPKINNYVEILKSDKFRDYKTINSILDDRDRRKIELNKIEFTYKYKQDELDKLNEKLNNSCDLDKINETIHNLETELNDIVTFLDKEILAPYSNNDVQFKLVSYLNDLVTTLKRFHEDGIDVIYEERELSNLKKISETKLKMAEDVITEYRTYESKFDGSEDVDGIKKEDNCNVCPLYNKFVKTSIFLNENRRSYLNALEVYEEVQRTLSIINVYEKLYKDLNENITNIGKVSNKFNNVTLHEIVRRTQISNYFIEDTKNYISVITYKFNRLSSLQSELSEYKLLSVKSERTNIPELKDKIKTLSDDIIISKNKIRELFGFIETVNRYSLERDIFSSACVTQLENEVNVLNNINNDIRETRLSIEQVENELKGFEESIRKLHDEISNLTIKRKDLVQTSKYLIELKEKNRIHQTLKTILEKKIPLKLLKQNLDFIEMTVNTIMEENDIQLSIDIYNNEEVDEVEIAVSTRKEYVEDIALCSSGELCLLGVVLNAVLMHIIGYTIISFDEMDSNLDVVYRESFHGVINSILDKLDIEQIFCVSHNISFDMNAAHIVLGEYETERLHGEIISY